MFSLLTLVALAASAALPSPSPTIPPTAAPVLPPQAQAAFARAGTLISHSQFAEAIEALRNANGLAGNDCFPCLEAMAATHLRLDLPHEAAADAREAMKIARSGEERARADNQLGLAFLGQAKKEAAYAGPLASAEESFRRALREDEKFNAARFHLARTLIREGRDKDADVVLDEYLKREPPGSFADRGRALRENHRRAIELLAPDVTLTLLDGRTITLASLKGKVVLLDFWATWCGPCRKALPELKDIRKKFARQPFEIVSISVDKDRRALEAFVQKNEMTWPQFFDQGYRVAGGMFGVTSFPSYLVLDPAGVIVYYTHGYSSLTAGRLTFEIRQALGNSAGKKKA